MQIIIDTNSGRVTVLSNDALVLRQAQQNDQHMNAIGEQIAGALGELAEGCRTSTDSVGVQEQPAAEGTASPETPREITRQDVRDALAALLSADTRYSSRSADAIAKRLDCAVGDIEGILDDLVDTGAFGSRERRSGQVVYSLS